MSAPPAGIHVVRITALRDSESREKTALYLSGRMPGQTVEELRGYLGRLPIVITRRASRELAERIQRELAGLGATAEIEAINAEAAPPRLEPFPAAAPARPPQDFAAPPRPQPAPGGWPQPHRAPAGGPRPISPPGFWTPVDLVKAPPLQEGNPWEMRARLGLVRAWWETLKFSLRWPEAFFSRLSGEGGYGGPLLYAMICQLLVFAVNLVWMLPFLFMLPSMAMFGLKPAEGFSLAPLLTVGGFFALVVLTPAAMVAFTFIAAAVMHLFVLLLGGRGGYQGTFRVVCFASSSQVLQFIPYLGSLAAFGLWFVQVYFGYCRVHRMESSNAAVAMILPAAALLLMVIVVVIAAIFMGGSEFFNLERLIPE